VDSPQEPYWQKPPEDTIDIPPGVRRTSLRFSVWDASLYAAMAGFGEIYFIPLLVAIDASNFHIGLFTAIPQLCIALAQLLSLFFVERFMVRKRIILTGATAQAAVVGFILFGILIHTKNPWLFIGLACGYYAGVGFTGPAWNSLMGDLTTSATRGDFFGRRGGYSQLVLFISSLTAGIILHHFDTLHEPFTGFAVIFAVAFLCRSLSVYTLTRHYEVPYRKVEQSYFSLYQFLSKSPRSNFAHFVYFVALMSFAVQVSAPFFATYMLRDLNFSYIEYTIAQGFFILAQFWAMRRWGPFADSFGNRLILRITATIMPVIPILWLLFRGYPYILALQVLAGFAWGGWMLSTANFVFDAVTPPKRARCVAYLTLFNCAGIFVGALLGAFLSKIAPQALETSAIKIVFLSPLQFLFLLSGLLRFIVVFLFLPTVHEVREVPIPGVRDMFMRLTNIRPLNGVRFEPYTGVDLEIEEGPVE
jgi:MFS family permease